VLQSALGKKVKEHIEVEDEADELNQMVEDLEAQNEKLPKR
jgi:hypothetical protein